MHALSQVTAVDVRGIRCGAVPLFLIAGPCVIEHETVMRRTAEALAAFASRTGVPVIFKSSFQKDNRSAARHYRGPGLETGLETLVAIREEFGPPVLSDVQYPEQVAAAGVALDVLQIPAYLCMQTDLPGRVAQFKG